jgi:geranylgeranyl diphosphate synthase type I
MAHLSETDPSLEPLGAAVGRLVAAGGKRLRPAFVYWGHRATGAGHDEAVFTPAAAVELIHAFALIHDDVMDHSPTRRGLPAAHVAFADSHRQAGLTGDARWFGISGAVLAGDLATAWAAQLFDESRFPAAALIRAREVFSRMQVEVIAGQYLELWLTGRSATESEALQVGLLKSGRYTVTRPLQLGAALGGGDAELEVALTAYGDAVGLAFQLRDDILGLFGDPDVTGKSTLDDVREGKRTLLVVWALERAAPDDRRNLERRLGDVDITAADVDVVRDIVVRTGALDDVEKLLGRYRRKADRALADVPSPAREALAELADLAMERST